MGQIEIGVFGILVLLFLIFIRVPIGVSMGLVAMGGIAVLVNFDAALGLVKAIPYELIGDWNLSAVPMFLLMGFIASSAGLTSGLFKAVRVYLGWVPGGLASTTLVASALFAAASGSSTASAAAFSRIAVPEMLKAKYDVALATGCVAATGTLASLIPPSLLMIVYGIMMDTSIAQLFIAGVIPGLLTVVMYGSYITIRTFLNPSLAPRSRLEVTPEERAAALRDIWPMPVLILSVLGGIFAGIFTATEGGAVGAALALLIGAARRRLTFPLLRKSLRDTAESTAAIFIIVVGALLLQRFMAMSGAPVALADWIKLHFNSQLGIVLAMCVIYLIGGCFLEAISLMLLTLPIMVPVFHALNIDLVWFCIIVIKLLEIAVMTPPVGMNVYIVKSTLGPTVPLTTVFRGAFGFVCVDIVTLGIIIAFPAISTWLPSFLRD